jgi:hypothetical protein
MVRKPVIALISGYMVNIVVSIFNPSGVLTCNDQLGRSYQSGLALMADTPLAAPNGQFGQLDLNVGTITDGAGSQRLARAVGKSCPVTSLVKTRVL